MRYSVRDSGYRVRTYLNFNVLTNKFRTKLNLSLNDECARAKRLLDEKYFEAGRLREEAVAKGD